MNEPIIQIDQLNVIYNQGKSNEVRALSDINLKIYPNEYVIIYGPSGCGKSTLLYAISGLQAMTDGEVTLGAKRISQMTKEEKTSLHQTGVGMIFQAFYLIPSLNIVDNVCLPKNFRGEDSRERKEAGMRLLHRFDIVEQAEKFPSQLSGGQKQRVSIARALINNPEVILADEPVGNLDSESAKNVMGILKDLNEIDQKTVILVTHNIEHLHYADRVIYMKDGKIIKEEIFKNKGPEYIFAKKEEAGADLGELSVELRLLMRTFKNLSPEQIGSLLIPFKADQLMSHILSELTEEQISAAKGFLRERLFGNLDLERFEKNLDLEFEKGGAGWNLQRARSFSQRAENILNQANVLLGGNEIESINSLSNHLENQFRLNLDKSMKIRFDSFLESRLKNKFDRLVLEQKLDTPRLLGGVGLNRQTAEKVSRELELILLLKYST